ncbi:hypothetical protein AWJ20_4591 [Sugiyamaella lignohabitans]|uniref:Polysaccharide biosynthesis domain-containing protein n=1 Tax=Sugiyamaella lignohabitans TaxID=796027 RepID=A0A167CJ58_9ASCO|nr:uncharacterized protein AWJ20_4591 [Sugiyamaella lignohabitans]ANB11769.1 hypothetical protein AWJ20_4591 [Sugiyamaella lignohabitans]
MMSSFESLLTIEETYWNLLEKVPASSLRLTKIDDEIYEHLLKDFPEFENTEYGLIINEDEMKSVTGKARWRKFMNTYENTVDDFNFGTLLRTNSKGEYSEENTIFVPRMQFYAVEIFRNKRGLNDWVKENASK